MVSTSTRRMGLSPLLESPPGARRNWTGGEQGLIASNSFVTLTLLEYRTRAENKS